MHSKKGSRLRGIAMMVAGFVLSGFLLCPGCGTSVQPGSDIRHAGYAWDTLRARLEYPIDEVYRAATDAVHQLDLNVMWRDHDGVAAEISTVDAQRENITIDLEAMPQGQTHLAIRAGVFGDKNKSEVIFEQLMDNLREGMSVAQR